jgi:predicted metal-dependent phosphoesterase TrpH
LPSSVDLHTHTRASDGTLAPLDLYAKAKELSIRFLAVTDHDSTEGLKEILKHHPVDSPMRIIPGIEMSAEGDMACHLLGYFIDIEDEGLQKRLAALRQSRLGRIEAMVKRVNELGFSVDYDHVVRLASGGSVGRPHLADAMVEKGHVRTRKEAFERFLKKEGPAYIPGTGLSAQECIALIRSAKGIPVLAHPSYYTNNELLQKLAQAGLMGIEVYYPEHSNSLVRRYLEMAKDNQLIATGGSDFHGPKTQRAALASVHVPEDVIENLDKARATT